MGFVNEVRYGLDYWGFVYLWRDQRSKMFCIGSHLGSIDDGYLSSTGVFQRAYRKRPKHFKRRIIFWLKVDDWKLLIKEEQRWLSMIEPRELSTVENHKADTVRYYNCKRFAMGGAWNKGRTGVQFYPRRQCQHCRKMFSHGMLAAWHGERCITNPALVDRSYRARKKIRRQPSRVADNVNKLPKVECTVCGMLTTRGNFVRWHGPNCKPRRLRNDVKAARKLG